MKNYSFIVIALILAVATVAGGAAHGRFSNRWGAQPDLIAAGKQLEEMPEQAGDWTLVPIDPLPPKTLKMLQCTGSLHRKYENKKTGDILTIAVLLGPTGPIAVHTPEICYSARDFSILTPRQRWSPDTLSKPTADQPRDEFWDLRLQATDISGTKLRVIYGWTNGPTWQAVSQPRFTYGGSRYLYKLQLAGPVPSDDGQRDPCNDFLKHFLPELQRRRLSVS